MSEFLASAASTMNVPEPLVQRSAEARAKATGASVDEVLAAWAGGAAAPASAAPAPEPQAAPVEPTPDTAQTAEPVAPTEAPSAAAAAAAPVPAAAAVAVVDVPEPIEPVALRERARVGGRVGMGFGVLAALFVALFSAQWLLARAGSLQSEAGEIGFVFSVTPGSFILGSGLLGAAVGAAGAGFVRLVTGWRDAGMRLVSSHVGSVLTGAVAGLLTGLLVAAIITGFGTPDAADETVTQVPMLASLIWTLLGWIGGGWVIGSLVHALGVPDGLADDEVTEGETVRGRLGAAFSLPVVTALAILAIVLPAAWVFVQFPSWAPLIAIFISGGIIAFAGLSAARPGMKITGGEFLVAAAGIGVVVLIVVAVLTTQGAGH